MFYKCERCGFISHLKRSIIRHLNNKKLCIPLYSNIERENCIYNLLNRDDKNIDFEKAHFDNTSKNGDNIKITKKTTEKKLPFPQDEMSKLLQNDDFTFFEQKPDIVNTENNENFICEFCNKFFYKKNSYYRHKKHSCKKKKDIEKDTSYLQEKVETMMNEINKLKIKMGKSAICGNIINGNLNVNNTININKFCYEDRSYITEEYINRLGNTQLYTIPAQIAKQIHVNPHHSENCNVKISSTRSKIATIYNGEKWIKDDKRKVITRILRDSMDLFDDKYSGERKQTIAFKNKFFENDKEIARVLAQNLELMFINNIDLIEEICMSREREKVIDL